MGNDVELAKIQEKNCKNELAEMKNAYQESVLKMETMAKNTLTLEGDIAKICKELDNSFKNLTHNDAANKELGF